MKAKFEETRSEISLGQEIVTEFIKFCQVREEFSPAFWQGVSRQMRDGHNTTELTVNFSGKDV
jgi:hypothetical protein